MPREGINSLLMPTELYDGLGQRSGQASFRDQPHFCGRVFGAAGDDVVVERTPLHLKTWSLVRIHEGIVFVDSTDLNPCLKFQFGSICRRTLLTGITWNGPPEPLLMIAMNFGFTAAKSESQVISGIKK